VLVINPLSRKSSCLGVRLRTSGERLAQVVVSSASAFVPQANASSMISCCSTACTFDDPDDGADIARREIRRSPVK